VSHRLQELVRNIRHVDNIDELLEYLRRASNELGFDYFAYGLRSHSPISDPQTYIYSNYAEEWQSIYKKNNYLAIDPTVSHGLNSQECTRWTEELFGSTMDLWEEAQKYDLRYGWAQSSHFNNCYGMLTFARPKKNIADDELNNKYRWLSLINIITHQRFTILLSKMLLPEVTGSLTAREKEVIRWTAMGKTADEIAIITGITPRTVNFHINNAILKLGATNKTGASVKAALNNLLN